MPEHWSVAAQRALSDSRRMKAGRLAQEDTLSEWDVCPTIRFIRDIERQAPGFVDHTGARFGRLTVVGRAMKYAGNSKGGGLWICECDCGRFVARRHKAILQASPENACSKCGKDHGYDQA